MLTFLSCIAFTQHNVDICVSYYVRCLFLINFLINSGFKIVGLKVILWLHLLWSFVTEKSTTVHTVIFFRPSIHVPFIPEPEHYCHHRQFQECSSWAPLGLGLHSWYFD